MHDGILSTVRGCVQLEAELGTVKAELATRAAAGDGQAVLAAAKEQELLHEHDIAVRQTQHRTTPLLVGLPLQAIRNCPCSCSCSWSWSWFWFGWFWLLFWFCCSGLGLSLLTLLY